MKGTVTISLTDFDKLRTGEEKLNKKEERLIKTTKELSVFLSFLASRADLGPYIEEFNLQSRESKIKFEGHKAVIEFRNEKDK